MRNIVDGKNNSFFHKDSDRSVLDFFDEYLENTSRLKIKDSIV